MVDVQADEIVIRSENTHDYDDIAKVVAAAFKSQVEADLVAAIRASPQYIPELALVAELEGEVVGHVMVSWTGLRDGKDTNPILHLSPLAVAPDHHKRGVGSELVSTVTAVARASGAPFVILEGNPRYYSRFGFEPSARYDITMTLPSWAPVEAAQILVLNGQRPSLRGHVIHPPTFAAFAQE